MQRIASTTLPRPTWNTFAIAGALLMVAALLAQIGRGPRAGAAPTPPAAAAPPVAGDAPVFHGGGPMVIVQHLVRILPDRYVAAPRVHLGAQAEVDVSTYERVADDRQRPDQAAGLIR